MIGLNMMENPERKKEARLARDSGEYTIAGPFELVQGGNGVLLFDPVYRTDDKGCKKFWGFSILVMDWQKFIKKMELDQLEDAGYHYQIWKKGTDDERIVIAQCDNLQETDTLEVACTVPNDTWYFEIVPENGWVTMTQKLWGLFISVMTALIVMITYQQFKMRRYRDALHEKELEKDGVVYRRHPVLPYAYELTNYDYLAGLLAFQKGYFYIQDISSMQVAEWAEPKEGDYVIDVCAAPGGKAIHLAEKLSGTGHVEARDLTEYKVALIEENIERS